MDARNNFLSCIRGDSYDRVPTFIMDTSFGMSVLGRSVSELYTDGLDPELSARSISAGRRYLGHDGMLGATSCGDTRAFGAEIRLFVDRPPMVIRHAFSDPMDLYGHSPDEMDGVVDRLVLSNNILRGMEPDAFICGYVPSPFLLAAILRGLEPLMMDLGSGDGYIDDLLKFSGDTVHAMNDRICSEGSCDALLIPGAYDNVDLIGIDSLKRYCMGDFNRMRATAKTNGLPTILHPHGIFTRGDGIDALDMFIEDGFECLYYGDGNDHRRITELTDDRCALMGGIDTSTTIFVGPDERVVRDTSDILERTSGGRFAFTCSCSVDANLDGERLKLMIDTVREWDGGPGRN